MDDRVSVFMIGAPKCATSALATALSSHPGVNFAIGKEPRFFSHDNFHRGLDWYHRHFADRPGVKIDGSTTYSEAWMDRSVISAGRIHEYNPDARIVYCVRSPLARAVSEWQEFGHQLRQHNPAIERIPGMDTFGDLNRDIQRIPGFLATSNYWQRLAPYRERFPDDRIHVVFQEDWRRAPQEVLAGVLKFVGANPAWRCPTLHSRFNDRWLKAKPTALLRMLRRVPGYSRIVPLVPDSLRPLLLSFLKHSPVDSSVVRQDVRGFAWETLHDDTQRFLRWVGRDGGFWGRGTYA